MRKICLCLSVVLVTLAGTAQAAEFQPMGALGIGGAGVARTFDAYAPYWNPAGLAFNETSFSSRIDASVGLRVNDGLADNVDRLSKINFDKVSKFQTLDATTVTDTVKMIAILNDIKSKNGILSVNGNAVFAMQSKHFGFGAFGTLEGYARPNPDLSNILPSINGIKITPTEFATAAGTQTPVGFFSSDQRIAIGNTLQSNGFTVPQSLAVINAIDANIANSGLSSQDVTNTLVNNIAPAFSAGTTNLLDNNTTSVVTRSLATIEFPLSYGHPIDMGVFGKLGVGASIKVISGRVYQNQTFLLKSGSTVSSGDITKDMTKNFEDSVSFGIDVGALWKYSDWLSVGVVAKNLNTPEFDAPNLKDKDGKVIPNSSGGKVQLKPQSRLGLALDPYKWLTLAADLDLTENEAILAGANFKSRNLGGGVELHPVTWFKLRGGMYTNLSDGDIGPVATAGLTLGPKWCNMDIDGAYGLETAKYKERNYPKEARVQASINVQF